MEAKGRKEEGRKDRTGLNRGGKENKREHRRKRGGQEGTQRRGKEDKGEEGEAKTKEEDKGGGREAGGLILQRDITQD